VAKKFEREPMCDAGGLQRYQDHCYPQAERQFFTGLKAAYMAVNQSWVSGAKPH
jgi:hypothetical protein